jgi:hypothetical protein
MFRYLLAAGIALAACPASASELLETYFARLSSADHFNSNGQRLTDVAAIIRQDRANFHAYGIRNADDQSDKFFASKANRAKLEAMLRSGTVTPAARSAIVNGTPIIYVEIYDDFVNVSLPE